MIWRPKPGQPVILRYRKTLRPLCPHHGAAGIVIKAGKGPGPINALVDLDGRRLVVPRGNLFPRKGTKPC